MCGTWLRLSVLDVLSYHQLARITNMWCHVNISNTIFDATTPVIGREDFSEGSQSQYLWPLLATIQFVEHQIETIFHIELATESPLNNFSLPLFFLASKMKDHPMGLFERGKEPTAWSLARL